VASAVLLQSKLLQVAGIDCGCCGGGVVVGSGTLLNGEKYPVERKLVFPNHLTNVLPDITSLFGNKLVIFGGGVIYVVDILKISDISSS